MEVSSRSRIDLPPHVPADFEVYVGGLRQARDADYEVIGRMLVFPRPIEQEGRLGFWRWAAMWLGIAGSYRKHETVDIVYEAGGRRQVETGLVPQPLED
jgi:hypothetical protein